MAVRYLLRRVGACFLDDFYGGSRSVVRKRVQGLAALSVWEIRCGNSEEVKVQGADTVDAPWGRWLCCVRLCFACSSQLLLSSSSSSLLLLLLVLSSFLSLSSKSLSSSCGGYGRFWFAWLLQKVDVDQRVRTRPTVSTNTERQSCNRRSNDNCLSKGSFSQAYAPRTVLG